MGIAKLSYLRPRVLDLSLSASTLKDCYVIYRNAAPDGRTQSFRLLSGPIFILTRLSLAYAVPERRVGIWKQLLVYLLSVNSLPKGDLRKSFHLADHEKWVELVLPNSESNIIGLRAHKDLVGETSRADSRPQGTVQNDQARFRSNRKIVGELEAQQGDSLQ